MGNKKIENETENERQKRRLKTKPNQTYEGGMKVLQQNITKTAKLLRMLQKRKLYLSFQINEDVTLEKSAQRKSLRIQNMTGTLNDCLYITKQIKEASVKVKAPRRNAKKKQLIEPERNDPPQGLPRSYQEMESVDTSKERPLFSVASASDENVASASFKQHVHNRKVNVNSEGLTKKEDNFSGDRNDSKNKGFFFGQRVNEFNDEGLTSMLNFRMLAGQSSEAENDHKDEEIDS